MNEWICAGLEPSLDEMFEDEIVRALMSRDGTDPDQLNDELRAIARRSRDIPTS